MADVKWVKLATGTFDDEKIKLIESMPEGDTLIVIWCKLLCLAGKVNDGGYVYIGQNMVYTDEMLATVFNKPLNTVRLALKTFTSLGMIEDTPQGIFLVHWADHQNLDGLERIREKARLRAANFRARQRAIGAVAPALPEPVTLHNAPDIEEELEEEIEIEIEEDNKKSKPAKKKVAPRVRMFPEEMSALVERVGEAGAQRCVEILDTYKEASGKTYKSDWAAMRSWVIEKYMKEAGQAPRETQQQRADRALQEMLRNETRGGGLNGAN